VGNHHAKRAVEGSVSRTTITSTQLYTILDQEFRKIRGKRCTSCRMPIPYWRRPPDDVSANWALGTPPECPNGCHLVIAELLARMWSRYDMEPERAQ
jgi:hypothetical protein